jgi:hypothetical protein
LEEWGAVLKPGPEFVCWAFVRRHVRWVSNKGAGKWERDLGMLQGRVLPVEKKSFVKGKECGFYTYVKM